eukprot:g5066.t1
MKQQHSPDDAGAHESKDSDRGDGDSSAAEGVQGSSDSSSAHVPPAAAGQGVAGKKTRQAKRGERRRHRRKRGGCRKCGQGHMHRQAKLGVMFAIASCGMSVYSSTKTDWTHIHVRRENTQLAFDTKDTPCFFRPTCSRCIDGRTTPQVPRPNPDGPRTQLREEWLPAASGCGWCAAQGRCLEGMHEHSLVDFRGEAGADTAPLNTTSNANFCGVSASLGAANSNDPMPPVWAKHIPRGTAAYQVDRTPVADCGPSCDGCAVGSPEREACQALDEGSLDDRGRFVAPFIKPGRFPGWLQSILSCNGTVQVQLGLFRSCQRSAGSEVCADNAKPGGPCYGLGLASGRLVDCTDFTAKVLSGSMSVEDQNTCREREAAKDKIISQGTVDAQDLAPQQQDLCHFKDGLEKMECTDVMTNICFGDGKLATIEQMMMVGFTFFGGCLALLAGFEAIGDKGASPTIWQLRLQIVSLIACVFCCCAALCQYFAMRTWRKLQFAVRDTLEVRGCVENKSCAHAGQGFWLGVGSAVLSFCCATMMTLMTRKFARRVKNLHIMQTSDISAEIEHGGWLEKQRDALEDDEFDDVMRIGAGEGGLFQESFESAPKEFRCFVYKAPEGTLPIDAEIEVVLYNDGPVFRRPYDPEHDAGKSEESRRLMEWTSWASLKSCKAVPVECGEGHEARAEQEWAVEDELQEVVLQTEKGDIFLEVDDADAFVAAVVAVLERISNGVQKGSRMRIKGDAIDAYTLWDAEYVGRLPDERGTRQELASFKLMAVTVAIEKPEDEDDMDVIVLDIRGLEHDYKFECDDTDVLVSEIVLAKQQQLKNMTGREEPPQQVHMRVAGALTGAASKALDLAEGLIDGAVDILDGTALKNLAKGGLNLAKRGLDGAGGMLRGGAAGAGNAVSGGIGAMRGGVGAGMKSVGGAASGVTRGITGRALMARRAMFGAAAPAAQSDGSSSEAGSRTEEAQSTTDTAGASEAAPSEMRGDGERRRRRTRPRRDQSERSRTTLASAASRRLQV